MKSKMLFSAGLLFTLLLAGCKGTIDITSSYEETTISADPSTMDDGTSGTSNEPSSATSSEPSSTTSNQDVTSGYPEADHYPMDSKYASYYASINLNQTGSTLKNALASKISGHTELSYSGALSAMKTTDRDWKLSPNSSESNPYMRLLYATYNGSTGTAQKYNTNNTVWDREHIWPQAHGDFGTAKGIGTDLHHLRASDKSNNNARGSYDFANVPGNPTVNDYSGKPSGKVDTTTIQGGWQGKAYEPQNSDKGDIARAIFYMATRYANNSLKFTISDSFTSNSTTSAKLGILSQLLAWNSLDPVDEFEMKRNNYIYNDYQHNRNPYVDHPELAYKVFA